MLSLFVNLLGSTWGRGGMMWESTEDGRRVLPQMFRSGMMGGFGSVGGFFYYLHLVFSVAIEALFVALLFALLRWLWRKGN